MNQTIGKDKPERRDHMTITVALCHIIQQKNFDLTTLCPTMSQDEDYSFFDRERDKLSREITIVCTHG